MDSVAIQRELGELRAQISKLKQALEEKPEYGLGEGDPAITRWELDLTLLQQLKERVASLEAALSKIDDGTYGICERCGKQIHPDRLAVLPGTRICAPCARSGKHE